MEHSELYNLLETLNIPVAYDHFEESEHVVPPFVAYREISPDTFKADNKTYYRNNEFEVELVTEKKDVALEKQLEGLFDSNSIPYDKNDTIWDNDEKIYHIIYII